MARAGLTINRGPVFQAGSLVSTFPRWLHAFQISLREARVKVGPKPCTCLEPVALMSWSNCPRASNASQILLGLVLRVDIPLLVAKPIFTSCAFPPLKSSSIL